MKTLLLLLTALLCATAALADVARPVLQSSTTKALADDLATGGKKMTLSSTGTLEWVNGATLSGASYFRAAAGLAIGTNVQAYHDNLTTYAGIAPSANVQTLLGASDFAAFKTALSLNNVENTAISTWAGSTNVTTLGTITTGTWHGAAVGLAYGGTGATTAAGARTALGLGTMAVQNDASVAISGGSITGLATFSLLNSGTGAFNFQINHTGTLTASHTLSCNLNNGDRSISLGGNLTVSADASVSGTNTGDNLVIGTTAISGGTSGYILYYNAGVLGNLATTGSGSVVRAGSPAFTGTPTAPTASAGNNSTQVATTAYADGAVSVLSASLQAATAKANAASVWTVSWYNQDATTSGSASTAAAMMGVQIATGSTAGSNARVLPNVYGWAPWWLDPSVTNPVTSPRWNKPFVMSFSVSPVARTAGGTFWFKFSGAYSDDGDLSYRGVGIKVTGSTMVGIYHNGTTGGSTGTLATFGFDDDVRHIAIVSDGAGNITWIVDGTAAATTAAGPATLETTAYLNKGNWSVEATNGADAAQYIWNISPISSQWNK